MVNKIVRELFFYSNGSNFLSTFWCKYAVQKSHLSKRQKASNLKTRIKVDS